MKVAAPQQRRLLELAGLDQQRIQHRHTAKQLPEHAAIADIEAAIAQHDAEFAVVAADHESAKRSLTQIDDEVTKLSARIARDNERLNAGGLSKDLVALQHEIKTLEARKSEFEDQELEAMETLETLHIKFDAGNATRASLMAQKVELEQVRDTKVAAAKAAFAQATDERRAIASDLPPALLALYDRVSQNLGTGAALIRARRCEGCHIDIDAGAMTTLKALADDDVYQCGECDRILVRTEESGIA